MKKPGMLVMALSVGMMVHAEPKSPKPQRPVLAKEFMAMAACLVGVDAAVAMTGVKGFSESETLTLCEEAFGQFWKDFRNTQEVVLTGCRAGVAAGMTGISRRYEKPFETGPAQKALTACVGVTKSMAAGPQPK